jgi:hypothetical protein
MRWQCLVPNPTRRVASGEMIRPASRLPAVKVPQGNNLNIRPESALPQPYFLTIVHYFLVPATAASMATTTPNGLQALARGSWSRGPNLIPLIGGYTEQSLRHLPLILSGNPCQTH